MEQQQSEFVMFVGIPASGKSTMAREYAQKGYTVLSSDERRLIVQGEIDEGKFVLPDNTNLTAFVFELLKKEAIALLKEGKSVVLDATNLGRRRRINLLHKIRRTGCKKTCVLFIVKPEECYRRNALREGYARVPDEAMYKMFCNFECPNYWEGWDEIVPIAQNERYEFDFSLIEGYSQDNPYHKLTLDGHINAAVAYAEQKGYGEIICRVLHHHDIGKYYTKRFENSRGEKTETAHFYGHENYSAYLYLVQCCCGKQLYYQQHQDRRCEGSFFQEPDPELPL